MSTASDSPSRVQAPASGTSACSKSGSSGSAEARAGSSVDFGADDRREGLRGRRHRPEPADHDRRRTARELERRQRAVRRERRLRSPARLGQRDPELDAAQAPRVRRGRLLRVRDAASRRHQVEDTRCRRAFEAQAVVVDHLAFEQPRDGLEADVRVRRDVHRLARRESERAVGVEEAPGADQAALASREQAPDREPAEIREPAGERLERGPGRVGGARLGGRRRGEVAHGRSAFASSTVE